MNFKDRLKLLVDGLLIPIVIYVGISLFVSLIITSFTTSVVLTNPITIQGIAAVFIICIYVPIYHKFRRKLEITTSAFTFRTCLYMIPLAFSICVISHIGIDMIPIFEKTNRVTDEVVKLISDSNVIVSLLVTGVVIPIVEEYLFRGFIFDTVFKMSNGVLAIIISSLLFGLAHGNLEQGAYGIFAGLFLAYIKYKYGRLVYTIIMHLLMNVTAIVFVSSISEIQDEKQKLYVASISLVILIVTLVRINLDDKNIK